MRIMDEQVHNNKDSGVHDFHLQDGDRSNMDDEVIVHKDTVVHEVEVPTTEQVEGSMDGSEQPDIVQGVPHSMADGAGGDMSPLDDSHVTAHSPTVVTPDQAGLLAAAEHTLVQSAAAAEETSARYMAAQVSHAKYLMHTPNKYMQASDMDVSSPLESSPNANNVKYLFCKFCPYKTRFVGNLTKHIRTHTGEKPFACRHCGKRFASRSNLNYHEATHTGNKRFMCFISGCQFKTQLRESLNSHMRKIHGVLISADSPLPPGADSLAPATPLASPAAAAAAFPMFSPGSSLPPNLPPIQDILTAPTSLSSMTLPQNSQVSLNDVKPSVAELAQYMIALHEGTSPAMVAAAAAAANSKPETASRITAPRNSAPPSLEGPHPPAAQALKPTDHYTTDTSPTDMVAAETDDSGAGSPRGATSVGLRLPLTTESGPKSVGVWDPALMAPRLPPPTMHTKLSSSSTTTTSSTPAPGGGGLLVSAPLPATAASAALTAPIITNLVDHKSSSLSNELLKIFSNLGLDTPAILDLLAAQGKLHICRSCNIVFPEYSTFVLHRGCHGNEGPFQCHFCQQRFAEKFGFMTHFMQCPHK